MRENTYASRITHHVSRITLMTSPRVLNIESGIAMVVTDLHGDGDAYQRYRDRFLTLQARGQADTLILNGDLIHHSGSEEEDKSLEMVLDVLQFKHVLGEKLIYLLGNHEMPHIYGFTLQKGDDLFTPRFEWAMGEHRAEIIAFLTSLPFYVRTPGGVAIAHAGASPVIYETDGMERMLNYSHKQVMERARQALTEEIRPSLRQNIDLKYQLPYDELVKICFAVSGPDDPRYDDFLTANHILNNSEEFNLLWFAMFSRNEKEYPEVTYKIMLRNFLQLLSVNYKTQRVLVTGHINCRRDGHKLVNEQQLRVASATHALPREAGKYLLFDVTKKVNSAEELLPHLHSVFE